MEAPTNPRKFDTVISMHCFMPIFRTDLNAAGLTILKTFHYDACCGPSRNWLAFKPFGVYSTVLSGAA